MTLLSMKMPRRFIRGGTVRLLLTVCAVAAGVALVCAIDLANRTVFSGAAGRPDRPGRRRDGSGR